MGTVPGDGSIWRDRFGADSIRRNYDLAQIRFSAMLYSDEVRMSDKWQIFEKINFTKNEHRLIVLCIWLG